MRSVGKHCKQQEKGWCAPTQVVTIGKTGSIPSWPTGLGKKAFGDNPMLYTVYISKHEYLALTPCFAGQSCRLAKILEDHNPLSRSSSGTHVLVSPAEASEALHNLKGRLHLHMPCVKRLIEIAEGEIRFYAVPDPWGILSNFSRHPIWIDGLLWPSTEHYYQAQKFVKTDPSWAGAIQQAEKPGKAANMGRDRKHPIDPEWESKKYFVMRDALLAKFTQHFDCKAVLLETGDMALIEDTGLGRDDDHIWGDGTTKTGLNLLGCALMEIRRICQHDPLRLPDPQTVQMGTCYLRQGGTKRIPFRLSKPVSNPSWVYEAKAQKPVVYHAKRVVLDDGTLIKDH